jgi:hypothetical protein
MWAVVGNADSQFSVVFGNRTLTHKQLQAGEELWEVNLSQSASVIEAPWLVNGGHGASLRH